LSAKVGALLLPSHWHIFSLMVLDVDHLSRTHTHYLIPKGLDGP